MVVGTKELTASRPAYVECTPTGALFHYRNSYNMHSNKNYQKVPTRSANVKTVNAVAMIHKVLNEIASGSTLRCTEYLSENNIQYIFSHNGIEATFQVKEGGRK